MIKNLICCTTCTIATKECNCLNIKNDYFEIVTEFCQCEKPDREPGYRHCNYCNKMVSMERLDSVTIHE